MPSIERIWILQNSRKLFLSSINLSTMVSCFSLSPFHKEGTISFSRDFHVVLYFFQHLRYVSLTNRTTRSMIDTTKVVVKLIWRVKWPRNLLRKIRPAKQKHNFHCCNGRPMYNCHRHHRPPYFRQYRPLTSKKTKSICQSGQRYVLRSMTVFSNGFDGQKTAKMFQKMPFST